MVLGSVAVVRKIAGNIQVDEMSDADITSYLQAATDWVENGTGVQEADWPTHGDYNFAKLAANNYAAAWCVLVVSTVKDATARHKELLAAAEGMLAQINAGASDETDETSGGFIDENSDYMTYENNPLMIEPYMSFR